MRCIWLLWLDSVPILAFCGRIKAPIEFRHTQIIARITAGLTEFSRAYLARGFPELFDVAGLQLMFRFFILTNCSQGQQKIALVRSTFIFNDDYSYFDHLQLLTSLSGFPSAPALQAKKGEGGLLTSRRNRSCARKTSPVCPDSSTGAILEVTLE